MIKLQRSVELYTHNEISRRREKRGGKRKIEKIIAEKSQI